VLNSDGFEHQAAVNISICDVHYSSAFFHTSLNSLELLIYLPLYSANT